VALPEALESSRAAIFEALGDPADLTLVRGVGNRGDELIWAGTRQLFAERIYRETDLEGLPAASGHTVVLAGGGAFSRAYHEIMPRALAVAELRFERVLVLPSSFDPSEDVVRDALARSSATVFAREEESYRRIAPLCDARLALDCAFFFDYSAYRSDGRGTLDAFRTDREASGRPLPPGNDDISVTAPTLEAWLETIAAHEAIRTDRAHVMIAAALLGKRVEFAPAADHKLEAIADYALSGHPVVALPAAPAPGAATASNGRPPTRHAAARVTAIVLTRDRPEQALAAVDAVTRNEVATHRLVLDNNSAPAAAAKLSQGCGERAGVELHRSDRNLGCAGGRRRAVGFADCELVLFVDDDAELEPGALDLLVEELDAHPEAVAVTATVVKPGGTVQHSGGWASSAAGVASFELVAAGRPASAELPPSGPAGWVPGTAVLIRRAVLDELPLDDHMGAYFEDNEWCHRVALTRPGCFRRSREARALHRVTTRMDAGADYTTRSRAADLLLSHARFYERHGLLLETGLADLVPELRGRDGELRTGAARLLMELLLARGGDWVFMEWMNGGLAPLLRDDAQEELLDFLRERHATLERVENGGWWRLRGRLLPALRAYRQLRQPS
jgi:hypothetical protein